ncbi:MAG: class I SAM-dependent methyltransferase [Smithellaceae bacterium]
MSDRIGTCTVCGDRHFSLLMECPPWRVWKCASCGLGILDPRPDPDELSALYDKVYFDGHYAGELTLESDDLTHRLKQEDHRLRFFHRFKKSGRLLDIGCGRGYFLLACRKQGYTVEGLDVSDAAAKHIRDAFQIPVHVGDVQTMTLQQGRFDIITLWHSLEHTPDPNAYIAAAHSWLADDGILVVDVPNAEGYDARHYRDSWAHWDLPFHFYHFTPRSLEALLNRHGFEILRRKTYLSDYVKEKLQTAAVPSALARIIAKFYTGGSFAVVARKRM